VTSCNVIRDGTKIWACKKSPDPRFRHCSLPEETAVAEEIKDNNDGPWNFNALQIPMFDRSHYEKYLSYPGWSLEDTLALLKYVTKFKLNWLSLGADQVLKLKHSDQKDCEARLLHLKGMAGLYRMKDIFVAKCDQNLVKRLTNRMAQEHARLKEKRQQDQQKAAAEALQKPRPRSRKQKLNLVYCKPETPASTRKKGSKKKKKDDDWAPSTVSETGRKPTRTSGRLRNMKKKSYVFDEEDNDEDQSSGSEEVIKAPPKPVFFYRAEKVLAARPRASLASKEEEYLVKLEGIAYGHCEWMTESEMAVKFGRELANRRIRAFQRERETIETRRFDLWDDEHNFNPAYLEVERILATQKVMYPTNPALRLPTICTESFELKLKMPETPNRASEQNGETGKPATPLHRETVMYLVKWKELSYVYCTWELAADVKDEMKIAEFLRFNRPPIRQAGFTRPNHPAPSTWYRSSKAYKGGNQLRIYQVAGLNWLINCYLNGRNAILADEMGLGKTVQIVAFLDHLKQVERVYGPHLIVVPLSTLQNWRREVERWTDMNAVVYHDSGRRAARRIIETYEWYYLGMNKRAVKFNILITTYEIVQADVDNLANIPWANIIVDEGHRLKNPESRLVGDLRRLRSRRKILLTGTPIQNNADELWALLNFIEPKAFASINDFRERFGELNEAEGVERLKVAIEPYVLRRMKEYVEKDIPPKEEIIIDIELTTLQKQYYRAIYERNKHFLQGSDKTKQVNLVNIEIQLRKCCNHPWLLTGVEEKETMDAGGEDSPEYFKLMIEASGKFVLLDKLLDKLKKEGHRVLIFSQMRKMLDLLEQYMRRKDYKYERLDGGVTGNYRQRAIDNFCREGSNRFIFLLSTRAGGVGLNLTQADTVIIFDIDWNPQQDIQAQARCHRIGQKKGVKVYRLVTRNTYESEMFARASKKLGLDHAVLHDMSKKSSDDVKNQRPEDIDMILRVGVYGLLDTDDDKSRKFCESDINEILKTSSRVITPQKKREGDALATASVGNINYSKMRFESAGADGSIDIEDPEFWAKVLPSTINGVTPDSLLAQLTGGAELTTDAAKQDFFEKLEQLSTDVLERRVKGEPVPEINDVISLLTQFAVMTRFDEDQRLSAEEWRTQLEKRPRRSANQKRSRNANGDERGGRSRRRKTSTRTSYKDEGSDSDYEDVQTRKVKPKVQRSFNTRICDICHKPGELITCDGPCERKFHIACLGPIGEPPPAKDAFWRCCECEAGVHRCWTCKKYDVVEDTGPDIKISAPEIVLQDRMNKVAELKEMISDPEQKIRRCSVSNCGRYYHIGCIQDNNLANFIGERTGYSSFRCPSHYCCICSKSGNSKHLLNCSRCPNAYHVACLTEDVGPYARLTKKLMYCPSCYDEATQDEIGSAAMEAARHTTASTNYKARIRSVGSKRKRGEKGRNLKLKLPARRRARGQPSQPGFVFKEGEKYVVTVVLDGKSVAKKEWVCN